MKLGDIIKRIFSHNKTEWLGSGKGKEEKGKFEKELKFDVEDRKNLLDPRVCQQENFVINILKSLGVREEILKNSRAIGEMEKHIDSLMSQSGMENWRGLKTQYTREQIENIRNVLQSSVISDEEKMTLDYNHEGEQKYGIAIDSKEGSITLQNLTKQEENYIEEDKYLLKDNGNVIINHEALTISEEEENKRKR